MPVNEDEYNDERFEDEDETQSLPQGHGRERISLDDVEPHNKEQSFYHECSWKTIRLDEVELGEQLGGGSVGLVHRGKYQGGKVALKTLVG